MKTRQLGNSGLQLTTIGLGTWAMGGGGWKFCWGPQDDKASIRAVHQALDAGINWIDTAAIYGHGHAETVVGQAIRDRRDDLIIATKCGRVWEGDSREIGKCLRRESILREIDRSLERLKIDVIDLYQIHWPEPDDQVEEGWGTVAGLVESGKIRYAGVSNFNLDQLQRAQAIHPVTSLQPPYSMLRRDVETEILPWCAENNVGVIAYSPMQAGFLTGKYNRETIASLPGEDWRTRSPWFTEPQLTHNLAAIQQLKPIAERAGLTLSQLALAWVLRRPEMTAAIVGARHPDQITETVKAGSVCLTEAQVEEIEAVLSVREAALPPA